MKKPSLRFISGIIVLTSLLTVLWTHVRFVNDDSFRDFGIYRMSSEYILKGEWSHLYNFQKDGSAVFRYIPPYLVFFSPWAAMDLHLSRHLWHLLQCLVFTAAFWTLYCVAHHLTANSRLAFFAWSFSFFISLRFVIDTLFNGQVEAFLLLGYSASLLFLLRSPNPLSPIFLSLPTSLKIAPGFLYFLELARKPRIWPKIIFPTLLLLVFFEVVLFAFLLTKSAPLLETHNLLWRNWLQIVVNDAEYFDSSIFKNQSVNGALLRLQPVFAPLIHKGLLFLGCLGVFLIWWKRRPTSPLGLALFFSLGMMCHLLFMPETMKYSMVQLAPVVLIYSLTPLNRGDKFILGFSTGVLALGGSSTAGEFLFRWLLDHSFGTWAMLLIFAGVLTKALQHSKPKTFFEEYETPGLSLSGKRL